MGPVPLTQSTRLGRGPSQDGLRPRAGEDAFALTREDPDALGEQRFVKLGLSDQATLLVVVYAYREPDIIRMLSAWRATKRKKREVPVKGFAQLQ